MNKLLTIILASSLTACANMQPHNVLIDTKNVDMSAYQADLQECQAYAFNIQSTSGQHATQTALGTGLVGAVLGGMLGNKSTSLWGTAIGAAEGYNAASAQDSGKVKEIVYNCLRGRGYSVLGEA